MKQAEPSTSAPKGPRASGQNGQAANHDASRKEYRQKSARDNVVDGSYGFDDHMDTDDDRNDRDNQRLYSDDLVDNRHDRGKAADRDRGHDRGRDRGNQGRNYYGRRGGY